MQLAISVLGNKTDDFIAETLTAISSCQCSVLELRTSNLTQVTALYMLMTGNWNHIAKLEGLLDAIAKRLNLQITFLRPEIDNRLPEGVPYTLETISMDKKDLMFAVTTFLLEHGIVIEEITASRHRRLFLTTRYFPANLSCWCRMKCGFYLCGKNFSIFATI